MKQATQLGRFACPCPFAAADLIKTISNQGAPADPGTLRRRRPLGGRPSVDSGRIQSPDVGVVGRILSSPAPLRAYITISTKMSALKAAISRRSTVSVQARRTVAKPSKSSTPDSLVSQLTDASIRP